MVSRPKLLFAVAAFDAVAIVLASALAARLVIGAGGFNLLEVLKAGGVALLIVVSLKSRWSYTISSLRRLPRQIALVTVAVVSVMLAISGVSFAVRIAPWLPSVVVVWTVLAVILLSGVRLAAHRIIGSMTRSGQLVRRTVIVGGGREADDLIRALAPEGREHMQILGIFDDRQGERASEGPSELTRLGTFEDLADFCQSEGVDLLIVTVPQRAEERLLQILQRLFALQVDVRISALNARLRLNASAYNYIGKVPMLRVMDKPLTDWDRALKNVEDRVVGALLLLAVAPVMALVALAVKLESRGPVFFRQKRYGLNNELIEVFKFRSMYADRTDQNAAKLVTRGDPRVTKVGRFIRRTSLDELPQLFNVLMGQMSLVGPRPHATQAKAGDNLYQDVVQSYFARHRVKPGITGWAQVNGWRGETDTPEKIEQRTAHDLHYIDNWSVLFDLYIIALTPISLVTGKNAY
ncbi:MAG: undecaprenyl-phosphate glucose phosphotransferase [Hyphomicrobiaceae bacterium]|nr:undecaprenyl-phosphate glucose phosphotransferase [Hyphomicrobiaceae bacterium]